MTPLAAARPAILHLPVMHLAVPVKWRVGCVIFRPPGWVAQHMGRDEAVEGSTLAAFFEHARDGLRGHKGSTAGTPVSWPERAKDQGAVLASAVERVRDAVAVLLLYQHALHPTLNTELQQFGLVGDIGATVMAYSATRGHRIISAGRRLLGVPGDWEFTQADVTSFRDDPRFAYLDGALRTADADRYELQRRAVTAVRSRALATAMLPRHIHVVQLATAVEALLGTDERDGGRGEYFRITRRAAYLYCGRRGEPANPYPGRPACQLLKTKTVKAMQNVKQEFASRGLSPECTWFDGIFRLFGDRNDALHGQRMDFDRRAVSWHEITTDEVLLSGLAWITSRGATALAELDDEIERFVAGEAAPPW